PQGKKKNFVVPLKTLKPCERKYIKKKKEIFPDVLLGQKERGKKFIPTEKHINSIANEVGYTSTSYFIYAFRKHFGNSPKRVSKEYRCQRHTGMNTGNTMNALAI
ncbi:AraC family transcriptional regulator, partial [Escherichia coli]|nr:AraC family transcriptional regulator [Escherichia coli]